MELILLKLGLALLVANCVLLIVLIVRRNSGQSINTLLANLRDGQADQERLFRDELGRSRLESATIAREHRQEINASFQSLSDAVRGQLAELGQSHTTKLDSFSGQIGNIAEEMGRKLDSSRETVDEVLRSVAVDTRQLQTEFRT